MKVEELQLIEKQDQVGVTLQREQFETEINIFPQLNPFLESLASRGGDSAMTTDLTSAQTEERLNKVARHQAEDGDDEVQAIPLKRIDSGPHQHRLQGLTLQTTACGSLGTSGSAASGSTHSALLDEIDAPGDMTSEGKVNTTKKESTLTRMLKGIRGEKETCDDFTDKTNAHLSFSKIFHRINPVGKTSRESVSKMFHRIGDALQKKSDEERTSTPGEGRRKTVDRNIMSREGKQDVFKAGEQKFGKIGEKMFRCQSPDAESSTST